MSSKRTGYARVHGDKLTGKRDDDRGGLRHSANKDELLFSGARVAIKLYYCINKYL
jgi:hypothetical protein